MLDVEGRHPSTQAIARFFDSDHLPPDLRAIAAPCETIASVMLAELPDDPELVTGLRKLLEAKDCFVRTRVAHRDPDHQEEP